MAASLNIYVNYISQPCRAVGLLCRAINAPHNEKYMDLRKGEHKTPEFMDINPFGKVPAIKDDDLLINESCAGMRYIANKYDQSGQWYPKDIDTRAKVDEYLDWQHTNTRRHAAGYFFNKMFAPLISKKPMDESLVNEHKGELGRIEKDFVKYFLASKPFIVGDHMTIADLAAACEFEQPLAGGYDLSPPVKDYLQRVRTSLGPVYDELNKYLYDRVKHLNQKLGK